MLIKTMIKEISLLTGISLICAFTINFISPRGIPFVGNWKILSEKKRNINLPSGIEINDIDVARSIYDEKKYIFVDARHPEAFKEGHIKKAINLPISFFDDSIAGFLENYPLDTPLIVYCSSKDCHESSMLSQNLLDLGYLNVKIFVEGYRGWTMKGYEIEK
ncbi:MAG: rhodanese-like domain-containing protein [Desulfobacterales bacterium]|nr:rhodanese-like domain-containing protein [Desulfobacterales bacterium]